MRLAFIGAVTYLAVVVQTTVCPSLRVAGATADLLILEALAVVLLSSSPYSFLWAGWLGLIHDLLSAGPIGLCMLWLSVWGYLIARLRRQMYVEHAATQVLVILLGASLTLGTLAATEVLLEGTNGTWTQWGTATVGGGLYTGVVAWPVLAIARRFAGTEPARA